MEENNYNSKGCGFCNNAYIDPELDFDNDLSYCGIGQTLEGYGIQIRSGAKRPTELLFSKWNKERQINENVGYYIMKFCPECGRRLFENFK